MNSQTSPSFDDPTLHIFALSGDPSSVSRVLQQNANVNAIDTRGRTVLACAVAGERWESIDATDVSFMNPNRLATIKIILNHPEASFYTFNAANAALKGVTPLGVCAWLNVLPAVQLLLEGSSGKVSVNGTDSHGATALMYAARDGSLEVVQSLLSHGARSDYRDNSNRSSIQHGLDYPQVLWLCEGALRRHRWEELQTSNRRNLFARSESQLQQIISSSMSEFDVYSPPAEELFTTSYLSGVTHTLINAIRSRDLDIVHSLLFVPATTPDATTILPGLVNLPDEHGWSAIHHCCAAEQPSVDILDALYCAGAELSLFTTDGQSVLHCLAANAVPPALFLDSSLDTYLFVVHLIKDLRAPLSSRDGRGETCIHVAAEKGLSLDVLKALLECDNTGRIRDLRNSRGFTALDICRPEFRKAFGVDETVEIERPTSSAASIRTIRPIASFTSISAQSMSSMSSMSSGPIIANRTLVSPNLELNSAIEALTTNLKITSPTRPDPQSMNDPEILQAALVETRDIGLDILDHLRKQLDSTVGTVEETKELLNKTRGTVESLMDAVTRALDERGIPMGRGRSGSEDSQTTDVEVQVDSPLVSHCSAKETGWLGAVKLKAWFKRKVLHEHPLIDRCATPMPPTPAPRTSMDETLRESHRLLSKTESDLTRIAQSLATAQGYTELIDESITRANRVLRRTLTNREEMAQALRDHQQIMSLQDTSSLFYHENSNSSSPDPYSPLPSSIGSLFSASSSTVSLAMTLTHADDDDVRGLRRLLKRKIQARTDGAIESLDQALAWLKIVREVTVAVKGRTGL